MNRTLVALSLSALIGGLAVVASGADQPVGPPLPPGIPAKEKGKASKQPSVEDVANNLKKAKAAYSDRIAAIRKNVNAVIDEKTKTFRRKKDAESVSRLESERKSFEGDLFRIPMSFEPDRRGKFLRQIQEARGELDKAYASAIGNYTLIAQDEEAGKVTRERISFREEVSPAMMAIPSANTTQNLQPARPIKPPPPPPQGNWKFRYTIPGGAAQTGAFKITGNGIYHLDMAPQVGIAAIDGNGNLNMAFFTHRKIINGETVMTRQANGYWTGTLVKEDGIPLFFEVYR